MKKYLVAALVLSVTSFWILPEQVTNPLMELIILGIIPGTNVSVGFVLPLIAWMVAAFFLMRWWSEASEAMLAYKTQMNRLDEQQRDELAIIKTGESANQLIDEEIDIVSI